MEEVFKRNLLRLRQPSAPTNFGEALFGSVGWIETSQPTQAVKLPAKEVFSEKAQVLESLERFAQEKFEETSQPLIKIEGGEIAQKPEPTWENIPTFASSDAFLASLSIEPALARIVFEAKTVGKPLILFVCETFRPFSEVEPELKEGFPNQLLPAFPARTAELFSRMLKAMKLEDHEILIYPTLLGERDMAAEVMSVAGHYRPELIVTLGANATHKILKGQERLAVIHGQFFTRKIENLGTFTVVPLFHPSIIENNQNMKKTAWADMQKIMKHLKKL